jgi:hypothetical protein
MLLDAERLHAVVAQARGVFVYVADTVNPLFGQAAKGIICSNWQFTQTEAPSGTRSATASSIASSFDIGNLKFVI